jgi:NTP pyrophosphatase (non-canonical NTP hydrolase)
MGEYHDRWSLSDWGVALFGEVGEACNIIKKLNRIRDGINRNTKPKEHYKGELAFELADSQMYLVLLAAAADIDLAKAVVTKFNMVSDLHLLPPEVFRLLDLKIPLERQKDS